MNSTNRKTILTKRKLLTCMLTTCEELVENLACYSCVWYLRPWCPFAWATVDYQCLFLASSSRRTFPQKLLVFGA